MKVGPDYGYFPNASKTCLIVKEGLEDQATSAFDGTQVSITSEGKKYLGSALGTETLIYGRICATEGNHLGE